MAESSQDSAYLQGCLDRLLEGDVSARDALLSHACERLRHLTRKMLHGFARVKRWEETDDVLQNALLRLWGALAEVTPGSVREFYGLAALYLRRELIDLARKHYGPQGVGAHHDSHAAEAAGSTPLAGREPPDTTHDPARLAVWSEFHQRVETLPAEEREVFDLVWYQGLTQVAAAALMGVSEPTLKRRWLSARRRLHEALQGQLPGP